MAPWAQARTPNPRVATNAPPRNAFRPDDNGGVKNTNIKGTIHTPGNEKEDATQTGSQSARIHRPADKNVVKTMMMKIKTQAGEPEEGGNQAFGACAERASHRAGQNTIQEARGEHRR